MNPLIQLKKATPLFVIALVLACFTLSPQAFAGKVEKPRFTPTYHSGCHRWELKISTLTSGAIIYVWGFGAAGMIIANKARIPFRPGGTLTIWAQARKSGMTNSDVAHSYSYTYSGPCH